MKKILLTIIITFGFIHAEEWIYYCSNYILARINPDGLENEILKDSNIPVGYQLTDISLDKTKLLYIRGIAGPTEEAVIFDVESMDMQVTYLNPELPPPLAEIYFPEGFYFPEGASFTDNENEIIFIEDQYLYKYSFLDSSVTLLIENENGGLYKSTDSGKSWKLINEDRNLRQRAWYYTRIYADTKNENRVYVMNVAFWRSEDGGKTFDKYSTPHGDHHDLWIDPQNPMRMINANDGGGCVSVNGGESWTDLDFPTSQFYHIMVTRDFP